MIKRYNRLSTMKIWMKMIIFKDSTSLLANIIKIKQISLCLEKIIRFRKLINSSSLVRWENKNFQTSMRICKTRLENK
jgi:hypothetical protein